MKVEGKASASVRQTLTKMARESRFWRLFGEAEVVRKPVGLYVQCVEARG